MSRIAGVALAGTTSVDQTGPLWTFKAEKLIPVKGRHRYSTVVRGGGLDGWYGLQLERPAKIKIFHPEGGKASRPLYTAKNAWTSTRRTTPIRQDGPLTVGMKYTTRVLTWEPDWFDAVPYDRIRTELEPPIFFCGLPDCNFNGSRFAGVFAHFTRGHYRHDTTRNSQSVAAPKAVKKPPAPASAIKKASGSGSLFELFTEAENRVLALMEAVDKAKTVALNVEQVEDPRVAKLLMDNERLKEEIKTLRASLKKFEQLKKLLA